MSDVFIIQMSIGDTLSDTYHMTPAEMGAYMRLYLAHCKAGADGLPADDTRLARLAGITNNATWAKIKKVVLEKFDLSPNLSTGEARYTQKRVLDNLKKIEANSSSKRDNALKRWKRDDANASNPQSICNATPTPTPTHTQGVLTPTPSTPAAREASHGEALGVGSLDKSVLGGSLGAGKGGGQNFDVSHHMTDQAWQEAKANAEGWDIYRLVGIYNEGVRSGMRERPKHPAKAFPVWCRNYTKGKRP